MNLKKEGFIYGIKYTKSNYIFFFFQKILMESNLEAIEKSFSEIKTIE